MIKGEDIKRRVLELLSNGSELENVLYTVTRETVQHHLPTHLQGDPEAVGEVLSGIEYYANQAHPEFISGAEISDLVLLRLIPKAKTERYIQQLKDAASDD